MVASVGRRMELSWGGVAIPGVREKGMAVAGEPIDVTSDEDDGWRILLSEAGQNQVDLSLSGVTKNDRLKRDFFDGTRTKAAVITFPDGATLSGQFFLASYTDTGPYNDAMTFEASLQSTGEVVYTPAS